MNAIKLVSTAVVLALTTFACAAPDAGEPTTSDEASTGQTASALTTGGGFTCGPHGCACDPTAGPDDPFFNCDGIDKVCKAMGSPKTCSTDTDGKQMCHCLFLMSSSGGQVTTTSPTNPIVAQPVNLQQ